MNKIGVIRKEKKLQKIKKNKVKRLRKNGLWFPISKNKFQAKFEVLKKFAFLDEVNYNWRYHYIHFYKWVKCPKMNELYESCSYLMDIFKSKKLSKHYIEPYLRFYENFVEKCFLFEKKKYEKNIWKLNRRKPTKNKFYNREVEDQMWEIFIKSDF